MKKFIILLQFFFFRVFMSSVELQAAQKLLLLPAIPIVNGNSCLMSLPLLLLFVVLLHFQALKAASLCLSSFFCISSFAQSSDTCFFFSPALAKWYHLSRGCVCVWICLLCHLCGAFFKEHWIVGRILEGDLLCFVQPSRTLKQTILKFMSNCLSSSFQHSGT